MKKYFFAAVSLALLSMFTNSSAKAEPGLRIGDKAPALDIEHWLSLGDDQFKPVKKFEANKVYIVEFWATWCGPCIMSMPHLAELQHQYADKGLQIISVTSDKPAAIAKLLEKEAKNANAPDKTYSDVTQHYCLASDPDESTQADYQDAARQTTIPSAFIVGRDGKIEWIGNPYGMDEPLQQIIEGTWDRQAFAVVFDDEQRVIDLQEQMNLIVQGIDNPNDPSVVAKALLPVVSKYERLITTPRVRQDITATRLDLMLTADPSNPELVTLYKELMANPAISPVFKHDTAWKVYEASMQTEKFNSEILQLSIDVIPSILSQLSEKSQPTVLDTLAHLQHRMGNTKLALETAEKAYQLSGEQPEYASFVKQLKKELSE